MPRRTADQPAYAVPEPGPSRIHLSAAGKVNSVYELGKGFFTPLSLAQPSIRAEHIRRLLDVMHVCLERGDRVRAVRAWSILVRCHEVKPSSLGWSRLTREFEQPGRHLQARTVNAMIDRILSAVSRGPVKDDLDYLETHILSFPFSENPPVHVYAGMLALYLGQEAAVRADRQPSESSSSDTDMSSTADAFNLPQSNTQRFATLLCPISHGYLTSARNHLSTALKLYEKEGDKVDAPAVVYVSQLLRLIGANDLDEADSDQETHELRHSLRSQSWGQAPYVPAPSRRRLNVPRRADVADIEEHATAQGDMLSRLAL